MSRLSRVAAAVLAALLLGLAAAMTPPGFGGVAGFAAPAPDRSAVRGLGPTGGSPAAADTAIARFSWRAEAPQTLQLRVVPDAGELGDLVAVVVEGPQNVEFPPAATLLVDVDWLEPADAPTAQTLLTDALAALPAAVGPRAVSFWRVYRLGPWRAAWQDGTPGEVLQVHGRLADSGEYLPVRDPRQLAGLPRWLVWALACVALAAAWWIGRRRWRRRGSAAALDSLPLPPPAWLEAALALRELDRSSGDVRRDGRGELDRLASIARRYVQARFHLPAVEMTATELAAAAREAGWPAAQTDGFVRLLAACDQLRYAPPAITARHYRDCLAEALNCIDGVRIQPVWTPAPAQTLAAATAAWQELQQRYSGSLEDPRRAAC